MLWGWAGEALTDEESVVLGRLAASLRGGRLRSVLREHVAPREVETAARRAERLLDRGHLPRRGGGLAVHPLAAVLSRAGAGAGMRAPR